jgi:hypothetical protein
MLLIVKVVPKNRAEAYKFVYAGIFTSSVYSATNMLKCIHISWSDANHKNL